MTVGLSDNASIDNGVYGGFGKFQGLACGLFELFSSGAVDPRILNTVPFLPLALMATFALLVLFRSRHEVVIEVRPSLGV